MDVDGDGSDIRADMFARFPATPGSSTPASPGIPHRRIRCKMCRLVGLRLDLDAKILILPTRRDLAAREHMMDHGQLSPPTPAALSRAPSVGEASRTPRGSAIPGLTMSKLDNDTPSNFLNDQSQPASRKPSLSGGISGGLKMTSLAKKEPESPLEYYPPPSRSTSFSSTRPPKPFTMTPADLVDESALADSDEDDDDTTANEPESLTTEENDEGASTSPLPPTPILLSPSEISAQLPTSLAALRRSSLLAALKASTISPSTRSSRSNSQVLVSAVPILIHAACSGYFLEPVCFCYYCAPKD